MSKAAINKLSASVALASIFAVTSAQGSLMYSVSGPGSNDAISAEESFLENMMQDGYVTEDFNGFDAGTQQESFNTAVGTFTGTEPGIESGESGNIGLCDDDDNPFTCTDGLAVLDGDTSPFSGRTPVPDNEDNPNWLDSMDYNEMVFDVAEGNNAIGFFMTDPDDQGGTMDILVGSETHELELDEIFGGNRSTGDTFYLSFWAETDINQLTFTANNKNDGYGIDNVSVGRVPEPGTLALMGLGLVGLAVARRRTGARSQVAA